MLRSRLIACGSYLPAKILTNADLAAMVDTSDEWITQRTGIRSRHIAAEGEKTSDLAIAASRSAMDAAGLRPGDIDMILLATATPDQTFPATATRIQEKLGILSGFAFDIQAVCSGFIYALATADNFIKTGQAKTALVIGAETFSRILDWNDRGTCVLFGDGAGAVILRADGVSGTADRRGILSTHLHSDGRHHDLLYVDGGPSSTRTVGLLRMHGQEVFKHAVLRLAEAVDEALQVNGLTSGDIDFLVPHQANKRIIEAMARKLGLSAEKIILTVAEHGNTSAASVPLALAQGVAEGRIRDGDLLLMEAMGGGFTWGSALAYWG